jgi:hypothetical protein
MCMRYAITGDHVVRGHAQATEGASPCEDAALAHRTGATQHISQPKRTEEPLCLETSAGAVPLRRPRDMVDASHVIRMLLADCTSTSEGMTRGGLAEWRAIRALWRQKCDSVCSNQHQHSERRVQCDAATGRGDSSGSLTRTKCFATLYSLSSKAHST